MNPKKYIEYGRKLAEKSWLPDFCQIETVSGTPVIDESGTLIQPKVLRTYKGSTNIPCRVEASRSFRPDTFPNQEININEYVLHTPVDVTIKPNDKIYINGRVFEVRKQSVAKSLRFTNEALIQEAEGQYDNG